MPSAAEIEAAKTPRGGWARAQLAEWGVPWPPPKGWRRRLIAEDARENESAAIAQPHVELVNMMRTEIGLGPLAEFDGWWYPLRSPSGL